MRMFRFLFNNYVESSNTVWHWTQIDHMVLHMAANYCVSKSYQIRGQYLSYTHTARKMMGTMCEYERKS